MHWHISVSKGGKQNAKKPYEAWKLEIHIFGIQEVLSTSETGYNPDASEGGGWDSGDMPLGID